MKKYTALLIIREMQIKTTMRNPLTPVRITIIERQEITSASEGVKKREPMCTVGGVIN